MSNSIRIVSAAICFLTVVGTASAQRRTPSLQHASTVQTCTAADDAHRITEICSTAIRREMTAARVVASDSTKSHTLLGIVIGTVAGGAIAIGANRVIHGKCDEPDDSIINCDVAHKALFVIGAVPGAILGGIIGHQIKTPKR
jgi:hypothetical protein